MTEESGKSLASGLMGWLKEFWLIFPLSLASILFYFVLWFNLGAIVIVIVLIFVFVAKPKKTLNTIKRYWPVIAILLIISISMWVRLVGFYDSSGGTRWPYLRNIDSYFFLRHIDDVVQGGDGYDNLVNAPYGVPIGPGNLYFYVGAYAYAFFNFFSYSELWQFLIWFPVLLASLIAIPMYYIGKTLFDRKAGFFAAIFMVFAVPFVSRSLGGDPDSDAIVMLFAMASIAVFLLLYKHMDKEKIFTVKNLLLSGFTGLFLAVFANTWAGYWFAVWIIGGFIILKLIIDFVLHRKHREVVATRPWKHSKNLLVLSIVALIVFEIFTVPFFGINFVTNPFDAPFVGVGVSGLKSEAGNFPNVGVSIAELMPGGEAKEVAVRAAGVDIAASVTGMPVALLLLFSPFILTILCFVYLIYSYYKRREHLDTLIFMGIWFLEFLIASIIAVRFTIFLAPVYAICSAILIAKFWRMGIGEEKTMSE